VTSVKHTGLVSFSHWSEIFVSRIVVNNLTYIIIFTEGHSTLSSGHVQVCEAGKERRCANGGTCFMFLSEMYCQ